MILNRIVTELESLKANKGGEKIPHDAISAIVIKSKPTFQWLTKDMIKYHIKKLNKTNHDTIEVTPSTSITPPTTQGHIGGRTVATTSSSVSTLTAASLSSLCDTSRQQRFPPCAQLGTIW
jgi:hypothetical protein